MIMVVLGMPDQGSGDHKAPLRDYVKIESSNDQITDMVLEYLLAMHNLSEGTKRHYLSRFRQFGLWLIEHGHKSFEEVDKGTIDLFQSGLKNKGTLNTFIRARDKTSPRPEFLSYDDVATVCARTTSNSACASLSNTASKSCAMRTPIGKPKSRL